MAGASGEAAWDVGQERKLSRDCLGAFGDGAGEEGGAKTGG